MPTTLSYTILETLRLTAFAFYMKELSIQVERRQSGYSLQSIKICDQHLSTSSAINPLLPILVRNYMQWNVRGRFAPFMITLLVLPLMGQAQRNFYKLRPAQFWSLESVNAPIDLARPDYALLEAAVFFATNEVRVKKRLSALDFDPALQRMARQHSAAMAHYNFVDHTNKRQSRYRTMMARAKQAQARVNAENVASSFVYDYPSGKRYFVQARPERAGYDFVLVGQSLPMPVHSYASFARELVKQWMNSPGHRSNILHRDLKRLGTGVRIPVGADMAKQVPQAFSTQNFGS